MAIPILILGAIGLGGSSPSCENPLTVYVVIALLLAVANVAFAIFLFCTIKVNRGPAQDGQPQQSVGQQAYDLFMYHPVVAIYICVLIFVFVWGCIGISWGDDSDCNGSDLADATTHAGGLLLAFAIITPFALMFSVCIQGVRDGSNDCCCINCFFGPPQKRQQEHQVRMQRYQQQHPAAAPPPPPPAAQGYPQQQQQGYAQAHVVPPGSTYIAQPVYAQPQPTVAGQPAPPTYVQAQTMPQAQQQQQPQQQPQQGLTAANVVGAAFQAIGGLLTTPAKNNQQQPARA